MNTFTEILFGLLAVPAGTTAATWAKQEAARPVYANCHFAAQSSTVTVSGQPIVLWEVVCRDFYCLDAMWIHGSDGVLAQWSSPIGNATTDRAAFLGYLATIKWP